MANISHVKRNSRAVVLNFVSVKGVVYSSLLIVSAVLLPVITHLTGASFRIFLPMHWPVILAGLVFGYRGGAVVGILSPVVSYAISGMPYPTMLLPMTVELFGYGFLAGVLVEKAKLNSFVAVFIALVFGRVALLSVVALFGAVSGSLYVYAKAALLPGFAAGLLQVVLMPVLARKWIEREESAKS